MFSEMDLSKEASERACQRGRQLYMGSNVQSIQVLDAYINDKKYKKVKAYVQGNGWRCYNVDLTVDEENNSLYSYKCECPAGEEKAGLCKHGVATALRYIQVRKDQEKKQQQPAKKITVEFPDRSKLSALEENGMIKKGADLYGNISGAGNKRSEDVYTHMPKTDSGLYRILMGQGKEKQLQYRQSAIRGKIRIEPYFSEVYGKTMVEFKIGITQMYVLKNILDFARCFATNEFRTYGNRLEFYHHISAFDKDSIPLLKFILNCADDFNTIGGMNVYQYYTRNDVKREMPLRGEHLDRFMEIMLDRYLNVKTERYGYESEYMVTDEKPDLYMRINGVPAGIRVFTHQIIAIKGARYIYIYNENEKKLHRCSMEDMKNIIAFQDYMTATQGMGAFIAESELPVFCRDLLPELEKHYRIEILEFNPKKYMPDDVKFEIYLDMPEMDCITCDLYAIYDEDRYKVFSIDRDYSKFIEMPVGVVTEKRDVQKEMMADLELTQYFPAFNPKEQVRMLSGNLDEIYDFLTDGVNEIQSIGDVYISDKMKRVQIMKTPAFSMGISLKSGLLELSLESKDLPLEELAEVLSKYNRKKKYYRLKDGSFINMQDEEMINLLTIVDGLQLTQSQLQKGEILLPKYRALYLDSMSREDGITYISRDKDFKTLVRNMTSMEDADYEIPVNMQEIMRGYQKSGYKWLKALHENGFGGILADDMGLGKTLQVIGFLQSELIDNAPEDLDENQDTRRTLIVCPASLVYNWESEIQRFAPELNTIMITGDAEHRKELIQNSGDFDVMITSYDLLKRDIQNYNGISFFCEVIDEAQYIKNHATQAAKAVKLVQAGTRFALTGTPMENRLSELWSIFDYLMPGFLYGYKQFREDIESPIVEEHDDVAMMNLRRFITPFILRRLKKDVLKDLPDKLEEIVYAKLEDEQLSLYEANVQKLKMTLGKQTEAEFRESKIQLLAELTRLRQICCNPALIYEDYKGNAAKVDMCMDLLENAISGGHKILLFSQFTSMLDLLIKAVQKRGISYYCLTGQTPKEQRAEMVDTFNKDDTSVFFISLKAGGTGLNLTSADIVIHFDPWWNLAAQNQATDRTHRIGQTNVVTVYKLIAKGTIEEKIVKLQEMKQELADQVLGGEGMDKPTFSKEELMELLG